MYSEIFWKRKESWIYSIWADFFVQGPFLSSKEAVGHMGHWDSQVEVSIQESLLAGNINMGNTDMGCTNNGNEDGQYLYHIYQPVACWMIIIRIWDIRLIVCSLIISIIVISTTITIIFTITTIIIVIITIWDNGRRERLSVCLFTASTASPLDTAFCPLVNLVHSFAAKNYI